MSAAVLMPAAPDLSAPADAVADAGWSAAVGALVDAGVTEVFGLPDDDMRAQSALDCVGLRLHRAVRQSSAVHMAAGHAALTGIVGACVIGRGPAVAAAVPGLFEAFEAGRPVVVLASGTAASRRGTGAFQDAPTLEMVSAVTKHASRLADPADAARAVAAAVELAASAPAGPVYLELPDPEPAAAESLPHAQAVPPAVRTDLDGLADVLAESRRPLLMLGSGARACDGGQLIRLADDLGAGVVVTASGRGCFPEDHPSFLGVAGLYLMPQAAEVARRADVVLVLGSRLEETALEGMPTGPDTRWVQANLAPEHLVTRLGGVTVVADAAAVAARRPVSRADTAWARDLAAARSAAFSAAHGDVGSRTAQVLAHLSDALPAGTVTVHENGLHDIWSYSFPHLQLPPAGRTLALSEQTTLGGSVAAAAGAARAGAPLTVCLAGDTALSTFLPDLHDVLDQPLPLLYVVFDDGGMGWLDREARAAGLTSDFLGEPHLLRRLGGAHVVSADDPRLSGRAVALAVERALGGRPTLLWVPVEPSDIAPQLRGEEEA